ncbi:type III polyketide synthase [Streptomyces roseirectus]|uniref:Type III polyketide synthase n=1 Tax=Streptomyces roseirectus TaxID=2768066 RepID=A0A7H0IQN4_9ACTN|nr:3,5-dihydroxyphenylacetyl-CoA synthase DpgA [Streptomyces roseirectus]QNP75100.1 type III polyketide synthase [Streptomyces roseirectus]
MFTHDGSALAARSPRIAGVGTAVPPDSYTQRDILDRYGVDDPRITSLFLNSAIERRHLTLPPPAPGGGPGAESQGELLAKHRATGLRMGVRALRECLESAGLSTDDVGYLCCVTTTGFLTPGFSALLIKEAGLSRSCSRVDVVGMGCNAGLNGLTAVAGWASTHPGQLAVMICIEACSAAYVFDSSMRSAVVNSLFGDGAAAVAVVADTPGTGTAAGPRIVRFASRVIPEAVDAMRYDWDDRHGKFSFHLDRDIPYVVGSCVEEVTDRLLAGTGVRRSDVAHWLIHSGGRKVIDSVRVNLGLTRHDVRHTVSVLRDFGNLSSGSFLFSYRRLAEEAVARPGDVGVLMTMGPGSTIETALVRW